MAHLPVIVGFGGINSAGRSSFHHGYRRIISDVLDSTQLNEVYVGLATMMGYLHCKDGKFIDTNGNTCPEEQVLSRFRARIDKNTLLRKIGPELFDLDKIPFNKHIIGHIKDNDTISMIIPKKMLPDHIPHSWKISEMESDSNRVTVSITETIEFLIEDYRKSLVSSGGQLPSGFDPSKLYQSNHHPRGLQLTMVGAADAIASMGIDWEEIKKVVPPDKIGVYSCSAMGQLDKTGSGGLSSAFASGKKITSKQLAMGLAEMPADFINAYILGNVGQTSANVGACATTLYNLNLAMNDIRSGKISVAVVGNSEAPLIPEVIESYRVTSALAEDSQLRQYALDQGESEPDFSRSCRPFGNNFGFTLGEASQYFVLFSDTLAFQLGAQVFGSIGDIYINADGYKKSIASPGFGNYICLAKAVASARAMFGEKSIREKSYIHAHGTGTPQNRTTESHGLNEIAKTFGISSWPVAAIKCYVGHSLGPASGDQMINALGTWKYGIIPGIFTLDSIADDVYHSNLQLQKKHIEASPEAYDTAFINAKGFGGNNATAFIISPFHTQNLMKQKYGKKEYVAYEKKRELVIEKAKLKDKDSIQGNFPIIYNFGKRVLEGKDLHITPDYLRIPDFGKKISLRLDSPYSEMCISED